MTIIDFIRQINDALEACNEFALQPLYRWLEEGPLMPENEIAELSRLLENAEDAIGNTTE